MEGVGRTDSGPTFCLLLGAPWCHTLVPRTGAGAALSLGAVIGAGCDIGVGHGEGAGEPLPPCGLQEYKDCAYGAVVTLPPPQGYVYMTWMGRGSPQ